MSAADSPGSGVAGSLRLRFAATEGRTALVECEQRPPLRVVRAFPIAEGGGALVHLHNLSGGVLGGDRLEVQVEVGRDSYAQLTTTGATRLYRSRAGAATAYQRTEVTVAENALLEYLPDPIIPFAGARYRQETRIALAEGAGLFWWETLGPGREAAGEVFAYELLRNEWTLSVQGIPVALERYRLEPKARPLDSPARLGPYRYLTVFTICRVGVAASQWLDLERELAALAQERTTTERALWGVSALPAHGLTVRGLSRSGRDVAACLLEFWRAARRALYGREPIPPRKVY